MRADFKSYSVDYAFLCDQMRREDNGKRIAIGIYSRDIVPGMIPTIIPVSLVLAFNGKKLGPTKLDLRALLDGAIVGSLEGDMMIADLGNDMLDTPPLPISLPHTGVLTFQLRDAPTAAWQPVLSVKVSAPRATPQMAT